MASKGAPELGNYLGNQVIFETNLNKNFIATFRGYDDHMNVVFENMQELDADKKPTGPIYPTGVIRGHSIISIESQDPIEKR